MFTTGRGTDQTSINHSNRSSLKLFSFIYGFEYQTFCCKCKSTKIIKENHFDTLSYKNETSTYHILLLDV